jgi:hypothetical protein
MAAKATTLLDVLNRRHEIEEELRNLQIERPEEEIAVVGEPAAPVTQTPVVRDTVAVTQPPVVPQKDSVIQKQEKPNIQPTDTLVAKVPEVPKEVVPPVVKRDTTAAKPIDNAIAKPKEKIVVDTVSKKPAATKPSAYGFTYDADAPHYAVVILNKVDNIFGNEARNAFNRFSKESYVNQAPNVQLLPIDAENKLLLIGAFSNILQATDYIQRAKPIAGTQIVPWLKLEKYTFTVISESNLELLKTNPNLENYIKFLEQFSKMKW